MDMRDKDRREVYEHWSEKNLGKAKLHEFLCSIHQSSNGNGYMPLRLNVTKQDAVNSVYAPIVNEFTAGWAQYIIACKLRNQKPQWEAEVEIAGRILELYGKSKEARNGRGSD